MSDLVFPLNKFCYRVDLRASVRGVFVLIIILDICARNQENKFKDGGRLFQDKQ
jgi:hypothetical protein